MKSLQSFIFGTLLVTSGWLIAARSGDVLSDTGISPDKLRSDVLINLKEPKWFYFNSTATIRSLARRLPESSRVATVQALGKTVRAYVESSSFRQAWLQDVKRYYPYDEAYSPENQAQKQQEQQAEQTAFESQLANVDQAFAQLDPSMMQVAIRSQLAEEERQLSSLRGEERTERSHYVSTVKKMLSLPAAEFKKQYLTLLKQQARNKQDNQATDTQDDRENIARYREQKAAFDAHSDFKPLLRKRLQAFIDLSNSVDFEARLVPMGYKQEFANPLYQRKPAEWKFLYRLGQEPVKEARAFAQQWLADLR